MAGIDALEDPKGCLGQEAKERLEELIGNKKIELELLGKDKFGRTLAFIFLGNVLIDKVLLSEGYGEVDNSSNHQEELIVAEAEAKKAGFTKSKDCP
ncbi:MAG: thermonuclease family protein [Patescibacteria group bacterium]